jgi:hypothetical protein
MAGAAAHQSQPSALRNTACSCICKQGSAKHWMLDGQTAFKTRYEQPNMMVCWTREFAKHACMPRFAKTGIAELAG